MDLNLEACKDRSMQNNCFCFLHTVGPSKIIVSCYVGDLALDGSELEFL